MKTARGEIYTAKVFKRDENSLEYAKECSFSFKCRVASEKEIGSFEIAQGFICENETIYLYASNIPYEIKPYDRVLFLGKEYLVAQVGYFIDRNRLVNASIFSDKRIEEISPKGVRMS